MRILGYLVQHKVADDPQEPLWSNTNHGNRHQRIFAIERVIDLTGVLAYSLYVGKHQISWAKLGQKQQTN